MLDALLMDFDGTLAPTSKRQEAWFKFYAESNSVAWPFANFNQFLSFYNHQCARQGGVQNVYDELKLPCNMADKKHPVWPAYETFNQNNPQELYPGMRETIEAIWKLGGLSKDPSKNRRLRLGINTTNSWKSVHGDLEKGGILQYFDCFITEEVLRAYHGDGNGDALKKPATVSVALALQTLASEGAYTIHCGDTVNDLKASQKVIRLNPSRPENIITVGACYGYEGRAKLEEGIQTPNGRVTFDYLIDQPLELIEIVKKHL